MKNYNRKPVFAAACLGMLIFGIVLTTVGSILPSVFEKYGINEIQAGSLIMTLSIGIMAGSLIFGPVVDRFGYKYPLIACAGFIALGLEGIAFSASLFFLRISIFLIGFGGGVINGGTNGLVSDIADEGKSADLSLLGVFFGVGAFSVPFGLSILPDRLGYESIISGVGVFVMISMICFVIPAFPAPKIKRGFPLPRGIKLLKDPLLVLMGMILFFESGMEIATGGWAASFLKEELNTSGKTAVFILSFYWLGMMGGRLALNHFLKKHPPGKLFLICIGISLTGTVLMMFSQSPWIAAIGLVLLGLGFAAGFPVILGYVAEMYPGLSGTAFSVVLVMALTGGSFLPYLQGILGSVYGLRLSFLVVTCGLCCMAILLTVSSRMRNSKGD